MNATGRFVGAHAGCEFVRISLGPQSEIPPHEQNIPMSFYVISGCPTIDFKGEEHLLRPGDIVFVPPMVQRTWFNRGQDTAEILVIRHMTSV